MKKIDEKHFSLGVKGHTMYNFYMAGVRQKFTAYLARDRSSCNLMIHRFEDTMITPFLT